MGGDLRVGCLKSRMFLKCELGEGDWNRLFAYYEAGNMEQLNSLQPVSITLAEVWSTSTWFFWKHIEAPEGSPAGASLWLTGQLSVYDTYW